VSLRHSCREDESLARQGKAATWLLRECDLSDEVSGLWSSTCCEVDCHEVFGLEGTARHGTGHGRDPSNKVRLAHWQGRFIGNASSQ
jgi:hypothetical protein